MRPIHLAMSGLQSYRETQEIDFNILGEVGIFGIFGPTGSGKSTILDAITLALYGNVERAMNRTRGIMNHHEAQLSVSFTFELKAEGAYKRYKVDRRYKRGAGDSVSSGQARLILIDEDGKGNRVICEKEKEVTAEISRIIGLSIEDFTRAVVLPQGKFSEFLSLKDADRTRMLQRLFSLDMYGNRLTEKVRARLEVSRTAILELEAERRGLGDCSEETLALNRERLDSLTSAARINADDLAKALEDKRVMDELTGWSRELELLSKEIEMHVSLSGVMEGNSNRLSNARKAAPILLLASERDLASESVKAMISDCSEFKDTLEKAVTVMQDAQAEELKAQSLRETDELGLLKRLNELEQLQALEIEYLAKKSDYDKLVAEGEALRGGTEKLAKELDDESAVLDGYKASLNDLRLELDGMTVHPEERRRISGIQETHKLLNLAKARLGEEEGNLSKSEHALELAQDGYDIAVKAVDIAEQTMLDAKARLEAHLATLPRSLEPPAVRSSILERLYGQVSALDGITTELTGIHLSMAEREADTKGFIASKASIEQMLSAILEDETNLTHGIAQARTDLEAMLGKSALQSAVSLLSEGQPCPLCGSLEHPSPMDPEPSAIMEESISETRRRIIEGEGTLSGLKERRASLMAESAALTQSISNIGISIGIDGKRRDALMTKEAEIRSGFRDSWQSATLPELKGFLDAERILLEGDITAGQQWESDRDSLVLSEREAEQAYLKAKEKQAGSKASLDGTVALKAEVHLRHMRCVSEAAELEAFLTSSCGDATISEIQARDAEIAVWDLRVSSLRAEEAVLSPKYDACLSEIQKIRTLHMESLDKLATLRVQASERLQVLQDMARRIKAYTEGRQVAECLVEVRGKLDRIKEDCDKSKKAVSEGAMVVNDLKASLATMNADLAVAEERLRSLRERISESVSNAGFHDVEDVLKNCLNDEEMLQLQDIMESYQHKGNLIRMESERLKGLINGRTIDPLEPESLTGRVMELQEQSTSLTQDMAIVGDQLRRMESDRGRWVDLTERLNQEQVKAGYLHQLTGYLKGNAFVQFMAEEHLREIAEDASKRLSALTSRRYTLEIGDEGDFIIRDNLNGGQTRPASTLSGGETFLTSLCLALSLSSQIQLRGESPLEFFFLDEGFGTLDQGLLDTVISVLERLHSGTMIIGIISHVPELRSRIPRKLVVKPATETKGSQLIMEVG